MGGTGGAMLVAAPAMAATEVAGVKPVARWNGAANIMGTLANLLLADGTATTASVMWNSPSMGSNPGEWMVGFADMPGNTRMMNGYLDPVTASMPAVVTVSGLPASITAGGYDVYVYVTGDGRHGHQHAHLQLCDRHGDVHGQPDRSVAHHLHRRSRSPPPAAPATTSCSAT